MTQYKKYKTRILYSKPDGVYYGKIEFITDLIMFHGVSKKEAIKEFKNSVNDYLAFCKEINKKPNENKERHNL